jgi:hypothetical protein
MARFIPDGVMQVHFVESISDLSAPTLGEIEAGTDATGFVRSLSTPLEGSLVDISDISSRYNKTASGTYGGQEVSAEFYRDSDQANDTMWNLLERGTATHIVVARRGGSGDDGELESGDYVDVWPVEVITRNPADYARNEPTGFTVSFAVPDEPVEDVEIVGGS